MDVVPKHPIAQSLDDISRCGEISAAFVAGLTTNDHRWELRTSGGDVLAVTRRVHSGGRMAQRMWKLVSATGMDAGNDIHVELLGADGRLLAKISSSNDAPAEVTVTGVTGGQLARSARPKTALLRVKHPDKLTVHDADDRVCAEIDCEADSPWQLRNKAGEAVGELLAGAPGPSLSPRWYTWVDPQWAMSEATYNRGLHLGIRRVTQYSAVFGDDSPRSLALTLVPLLAGLAY